HPLRREAPRIAFCPHDGPRPLAAAHHHAASVRRPGRVCHCGAGARHDTRKGARRRTGNCLAAPAAKSSCTFLLTTTITRGDTELHGSTQALLISCEQRLTTKPQCLNV